MGRYTFSGNNYHGRYFLIIGYIRICQTKGYVFCCFDQKWLGDCSCHFVQIAGFVTVPAWKKIKRINGTFSPLRELIVHLANSGKITLCQSAAYGCFFCLS